MEINDKKLSEIFKGHQPERILPAPDKSSAVLVSLVEGEQGLDLLFEERIATIDQGGEICYPGGRIQKGETPEEAAVRETMEELFVDAGDVQVIAPLNIVPGPGGAEITSYLGIIRNYQGTFSTDEVERMIRVPLAWFLENEPEAYDADFVMMPEPDFPYHLIPNGRDYNFKNIHRRFYFYETEDGDVIWGLTANLTVAFIRMLKRELGMPCGQ